MPEISFNCVDKLSNLSSYYGLVSERYLEGTKRFHNVTNYFLVAEAFLFSFYGQFLSAQKSIIPFIFTLVGFLFCIIWFLVLFRIEHMRDLRKNQGKKLEKQLQNDFGIEIYIFRKEEYDSGFGKGKKSNVFMKIIQNVQIPYVTYCIPLLFSIAWLAFMIAIFTQTTFLMDLKTFVHNITS